MWKKHINPVADTLCYCLMPNHFHFIVYIKEVQCLPSKKHFSQPFANFFNCYAKSYNIMYNRHGNLFTQNFKRKLIDDEKYLIYLLAYIHLNPVKDGYTNHIQNWKFSSIHEYLTTKKSWLRKDKIMQNFIDVDDFLRWHELLHQMMLFRKTNRVLIE
jgi:putative transposase